ncbi:riboflavin kinase [Hyaloraphidium curvatum]|nr:riboflavin kinase [Hyaloraphidium curvatum]
MATPSRPSIVGDDAGPTLPYPVYLRGKVCKGFGRGSRELGIPTANLPEDVSNNEAAVMDIGIHYGWAGVGSSEEVYGMVMSYGWNPYYKNEKKTAEVHIFNKFGTDFYDEELRIIVLGYIRPEQNYDSLDALIADIQMDIQVAKNSLARPVYQKFSAASFLKPHSGTNL